ncbi:MAG: ATP-binding protein [Clostridiales Family XIII bacterium]|jgi:predicted AAA+ superfamily ATPase|nr:ATP-binding protein [Clostridiales Family XIII bacterium]
MNIVTDAQVVKVLQQVNSWWRNPTEIESRAKPQKRVAYYEANKVIEHESIRRFVVLSGARRVGKTTILYQMIDKLLGDGVNPKNILYVSFDNPIIKLVNVDDVLGVYETLYPLEGKRYLFFDEIQYTKDWELWMKIIYDTRDDVCLTATGSASPVLEKSASDSGAGRWNVLKVPTMSFYEYCELLSVPERPIVPDSLRITGLSSLPKGELADLMNIFTPLQQHFNRYMMVGGFPELALADDDSYAQRMLREDVVDKVIKRDVMSLFNIRNPLSMEKLFLYLCMHSSCIFNKQTTASALENIGVSTIEDYIRFLEMSNLIYISHPVSVGSKSGLKGKPKIYIADAAIRNAVLMIDDVLSDNTEMGIVAETVVYKHIVSYYQNTATANVGYYRKARDNQKEVDVVVELPKEKILCEVKYRNNSVVPKTDAIVTLSRDDNTNVSHSFVVTKSLTDYGVSEHNTKIPILHIPLLPFVYILGRGEAIAGGGKTR